MISKSFFFVFATFLLLYSCMEEKRDKPKSIVDKDLAMAPEGWIRKRVQKAAQRFNATEAGKIVWQAMEAHGGLENWYGNGPVSFHFNYQPLDGGVPRNTYQVVDTWSSRARHYQAGDSLSQYGWDGKAAWVMAKDSTTFNYNTRFWSLTPYFFMAQPFVLDGKGVQLEQLPQRNHNGKIQDVIKVTFDPGTGDAPDDYYILYFDGETHLLNVIRYIVSYPGYFEKGKHLPEKFMLLEGKQTIKGIPFPKTYKTFWLTNDGQPGEHITDITLDAIKFMPKLEAELFHSPPEAKILDGL